MPDSTVSVLEHFKYACGLHLRKSLEKGERCAARKQEGAEVKVKVTEARARSADGRAALAMKQSRPAGQEGVHPRPLRGRTEGGGAWEASSESAD